MKTKQMLVINTKNTDQRLKINNNKKLPDNDKMNNMLMQISELINNNNNNNLLSSFIGQKKRAQLLQHSTQIRQGNINPTLTIPTNKLPIQSIITQSSRLLQQRKQFSQTKASTKGKIMAACQLLNGEKEMIKQYIKQKIQSQLFMNQNTNKNKVLELDNRKDSQSNKQERQNSSSVTDRHLLRLQQQRAYLIEKKRFERQKQQQKRQQLISQVKQFEIDSRVNVNIQEINSLIYKQQPQSGYLVSDCHGVNVRDNGNSQNISSIGKEVKSRSNEVKISSLYMSQVYDQHEIQQASSRINNNKNKNNNINNNNSNKQSKQQSKYPHQLHSPNLQQSQQQLQQFIQIHDEIETHNNKFNRFYQQQHDITSTQSTINQVLKKHPKFVKIFYQFLTNQFAITKINNNSINTKPNILSQKNQSLSNNSPTSQLHTNKNYTHTWKQQKIKPLNYNNKNANNNKQSSLINNNNNHNNKNNNNHNNKQTITKITQHFKFKPFTINQSTKIQYQKQKISQTRVNKMIGDSSKFHAKKCILTKNQLIYYQEKQTNPEKQNRNKIIQLTIPQTTKHIQLQIQRVIPQIFKKEEGSFFSKKEINTQIVQVKGKARTFKFQLNFLQGKELLEDLRTLMAAKVYALGCKVNGTNNLPLLQFIYSPKMQNFYLSQSIIPIQSYLIKQDRQKHLNILLDTFLSHQQTATCLILEKTKLQPDQITLILKQCKKLQKLTKIDLTNIRLSKQNFMQLCQLINGIKIPSNGIEVILSNCKLDDDCFMSNIGVFTSVCSKINKLDISHNMITSKTLAVIKSCLQSATSIIKHLNISNCSIRDLTKLSQLIKQSRKLQSIQAQNCSLNFDQKRFEEMQRFFDFLKSISSPNIKTINLSKNGALTKKQFTMIQNIWYEKNIQQLIIDLDVEMMISEKDQKQLLRPNNSISKNMLNMRLYWQERSEK